MRDGGAVPATIGVLDGEVVVGLDEDELARFDASARKVGPRDLAAAVVQGAVGATTVGGTLVVCRGAGIRSWRPAGSAASTAAGRRRPDVSADLDALAATRVARRLVGREVAARRAGDRGAARDARRARCSAGARTSCRSSTRRAAARRCRRASRRPTRRRAIAAAHWELGGGGLLLGRPPDESLDDVEPLIEQALADAEAAGVHGRP